MQPGEGTLVVNETRFEEMAMEKPLISGIAFSRDEAKLMVLGVPDHPGVAYQLLGPVSQAHIEIDMIIQNQSVAGQTDFTFTVARQDLHQAQTIVEQAAQTLGARTVMSDDSIAKLSMVGIGMKSHSGVASTMFQTLAQANINIQMIATTEIKISVVIDQHDLDDAVQRLHSAFDLD